MMLKSPVIWAVILGFSTAQILKAILKRDIRAVKDYGGMPSGHSALVFSTLTSVGWTEGFDSPVFGLALAFTLITISDAVRVRSKLGMGHKPLEIFVGAVIGVIVGTFTTHFPWSP